MTAPIDVQFIAGKDGAPEYAVIPFKVFQTLCNSNKKIHRESDDMPHINYIYRGFTKSYSSSAASSCRSGASLFEKNETAA